VSEFDPKGPIPLHVGAITALACWLAAVLAFALHLDDPWWAVISAWIVANPERHALLEKAANRILGTVIGCVAGYWVALWALGRPVLQTAAMFVLAAVGVYGRFRSAQSYAWIIGAVGGLSILSTSLETPGEIYHLAWFRTCEVICGVVAATVIELLLYRQNSPIGSRTAPTKSTDKAFAPTMESCHCAPPGDNWRCRDHVDSDSLVAAVSAIPQPDRDYIIGRPGPRRCVNAFSSFATGSRLSGRRRIRPSDDPIWNRFVFDLVRYAGRGHLPFLPFTP
jgi:hypothetical protein